MTRTALTSTVVTDTCDGCGTQVMSQHRGDLIREPALPDGWRHFELRMSGSDRRSLDYHSPECAASGLARLMAEQWAEVANERQIPELRS